jgi:hypothetical protein
MKILIAIDAPGFGKKGWGREAQWENSAIGAALRLIASRLEFGQPSGALDQDGMTAHWKIEQVPAAPAKGEAA